MPKGDNPKSLKSLKSWKKGQSGNPKGSTPSVPELKEFKKLSKAEMVDIGNLVVKGDVSELQKVAKDPTASVLKVMVAACAAKIISKGDVNALDTLLNRLIGKVRDEIHHSGEINPPQIIITLPDNGRVKK